MMQRNLAPKRMMLLLGFLGSSIFIFWTLTQTAHATDPAGETAQALPAAPSSKTVGTVPFPSTSVGSQRAAAWYRRIWGIDDVTLKATASGAVIRFSYRVVDADKAAVLNDKKEEPYLFVQKNGARLEVPAAEKVGKLRQTATPQNGREYWMVFQNSSHMVRPGDRVNIVIGTFRANNLVVEPSQVTPPQRP